MDAAKQPRAQAVFDDWPDLLDIDPLANQHVSFNNELQIGETPFAHTLLGVDDARSSAVEAGSLLSEQHNVVLPPSPNNISGSTGGSVTTRENFEQFDALTTGGVCQCSGYPPPETGAPSKQTFQTSCNCHAHPEELPPDSNMGTGKRFGSRTTKILKTWIAAHAHHPYPRVEEIELMQKQTGLSRQQIVTWLSNARRRLKTQSRRPPTLIATPFSQQISRIHEQNLSFEEMDPLQRWQNSPPEHEPAATSAILKAVSGFSVPDGCFNTPMEDVYLTDGWWDDSSASSAITSKSSSSSLGSAWSAGSQRSGGLFNHQRKSGKRRRRRTFLDRSDADKLNRLQTICHTYQCTFCTETFKTKHNWQRHEKSLHLSLEQWKCSPQGPTCRNLESDQLMCAYCEQIDPSHDHISQHNYAACNDRDADERTFYRKDHLQQHLKLVHNSKFMRWPMEQWKQEIVTLRSRCGFCELIMDSWADRVDHLAEHFRRGQTMASWKGDWGFDSHVLDMVENSMPPYLIHYERNSPWPFTTQQGLVESPVNAFELIKLELDFWVNNINAAQRLPTNQELQYESCCIILGSEMHSKHVGEPGPSWLRDLLMSSEEITKQARMHPMKTSLKARITQLQIHSKGNIFENCSAEDQLRKYVDLATSSGLVVGYAELQFQASNIIALLEASAKKPSPMFVRFLNDLIFASTQWLVPFCCRSHLELGREIAPRHRHMWQQVAAPTLGESSTQAACALEGTNESTIEITRWSSSALGKLTPYLQDDSNCYRRLTRELSLFVASTVSPHNPKRRIPSDEELQYQARWIMFEDDDPWNQTPADNPQWLEDFKIRAGLVTSTSGYREIANVAEML